MKNIILMILMIFSGYISGQTSLSGKVKDAESGELLPFANVAVYKGTDLVTGTQTDFDGFYNLANLDPGTYEVEATYSGYELTRFIKVIVYGGQANNLDFDMGHELQIFKYIPPKIQNGCPEGCGSLNEHLKKLPIRTVIDLSEYRRRREIALRFKDAPIYYKADLMQKLPGRTINSMTQNMLDLGVKRISLEKVEIQYWKSVCP